jgi:putative membrane protein
MGRGLVLGAVIGWGVNIVALLVVDWLFDGVEIGRWGSLLLAAAVLGIANAILKPILTVLTFPLIVLTLGLFYFVLNIAMLALAEWIAPNFSINGFWTYIGATIVVWIVNWVLYTLFDTVTGDCHPPADRLQPAPPDRGARPADQPPVAAELPRRLGVRADDSRLGPEDASLALGLDREVHRRLGVARLSEHLEILTRADRAQREVSGRAPEATDGAQDDLRARLCTQINEARLEHLRQKRCARIAAPTSPSQPRGNGPQAHQRPKQPDFVCGHSQDRLVRRFRPGRNPELVHLVHVVVRHDLVEMRLHAPRT